MWNSFRRRAANIFVSKNSAKAKPSSQPSKVDSILAGKTHNDGAKIPHQPQPSVEYEESLQSSGLRGMDAIRASASSMLGRTTSTMRSAANEAKTGIEQTVKKNIESSISHGGEAANRVTGYADGLRRSAGENIDKNLRVASGRLVSVASSVKDEAYRKSLDAATSVSTNATKLGAGASTAASHRATRQAVGTLSTEMREARDKMIRWAWWWSLAAVGIYAFASAIPGEIRRYITSGDDKKSNDEKQKERSSKSDNQVDITNKDNVGMSSVLKSGMNELVKWVGKTGDS